MRQGASICSDPRNLTIPCMAVEECHKWESKGIGMCHSINQDQRRLIDRTLGVDHLERVLPQTTKVAVLSVKDFLEFVPDISELEDSLTSHSQEAEEIVDRLDGELDKIGEGLEPKIDIEDTISAWEMSTPKRKKITFEEEVRRSVLFHDNISLSRALGKFRSALEKAAVDSTEASRGARRIPRLGRQPWLSKRPRWRRPVPWVSL